MASPKPFSSAWTSRSMGMGSEASVAGGTEPQPVPAGSDPLFLLQCGRQHLGDIDHLTLSHFADDQRIEELPLDAVRLLAAQAEWPPDRLELLLRQDGQHPVGVDAARLLHGLREHVESRVVDHRNDAGHLPIALLVRLAELPDGWAH